ncbi:MAG: hypothetical protein Q9219_007103 [cf. Caloplaca sp. 3 TL-2023]
MNGSQICVSAPSKPYVTPSVSLVAPTIYTTPAPVPTDIADVNTYSGRPGYQSVTVTQGPITDKFDDLPDATYITPTATATSDGASSNCTQYTDVEDGDSCQNILDLYDLTIAQFFALNSAVKSDCSGLWTGYQYCIEAPGATPPTSTTTIVGNPPPSPTSPVQNGQPSNCDRWYTVISGNSCSSVEQMFFITHAQFRKWNPAVSEDCTDGFWLEAKDRHFADELLLI